MIGKVWKEEKSVLGIKEKSHSEDSKENLYYNVQQLVWKQPGVCP